MACAGRKGLAMSSKLPEDVIARKQILYGVSPLIGIDEPAFTLLASLATESHVSAGHVIVRQGDIGDEHIRPEPGQRLQGLQRRCHSFCLGAEFLKK